MIKNKKANLEKNNVDKIIFEVMRFYGFRRNYQVAEYFEVTPQTLSGWIKSGEIPPKHLIKFQTEIESKNIESKIEKEYGNKAIIDLSSKTKNPFKELKSILYRNRRIIFTIPSIFALIISIYIFYLAEEVYTSKSKVLPVSEDGSTTGGFSGFASQLGINMPINIGGKVPWDEIYPEILKSSDLLNSIIDERFITKKYGKETLFNIMVNEYSLFKYEDQNKKNRIIDLLREKIIINKDRSSPIVNINVMAFEPAFAKELAEKLIIKSSVIQRQLKTNRVKQKRMFIEERLEQVSTEMKILEKKLREFREENRNLSSSPILQMKVQEMGREVDLQNSLYVTLKTQYEKAKIDEVGRDDMVQQIDGPSLPTELTSPKRLLSFFMSIFFGFFTSIFIIYFKEQGNKLFIAS